MEREKGFEPSTSTLARLHSTTELLPHPPRGGPHFYFDPAERASAKCAFLITSEEQAHPQPGKTREPPRRPKAREAPHRGALSPRRGLRRRHRAERSYNHANPARPEHPGEPPKQPKAREASHPATPPAACGAPWRSRVPASAPLRSPERGRTRDATAPAQRAPLAPPLPVSAPSKARQRRGLRRRCRRRDLGQPRLRRPQQAKSWMGSRSPKAVPRRDLGQPRLRRPQQAKSRMGSRALYSYRSPSTGSIRAAHQLGASVASAQMTNAVTAVTTNSEGVTTTGRWSMR